MLRTNVPVHMHDTHLGTRPVAIIKYSSTLFTERHNAVVMKFDQRDTRLTQQLYVARNHTKCQSPTDFVRVRVRRGARYK